MTRLFVSDLDGTLLDPSAALSARSRTELMALLQSGIRFTVAIAELAMRAGLAESVQPFVTTYADGRQRLYPPTPIANAGQEWYLASRIAARDPRLQPAAQCLSTLDQTILCITMIARRERVLPIAAQIERAFPGATNTLCYENRYSPGWEWLTVQSAHATKDARCVRSRSCAGSACRT